MDDLRICRLFVGNHTVVVFTTEEPNAPPDRHSKLADLTPRGLSECK